MLSGRSNTGIAGSDPTRVLFAQILSSDCTPRDVLIPYPVGHSRLLFTLFMLNILFKS
jgi:hypothetical protein